MIAQLTGTLLESTPTTAVVDVQGVGYEVQTPLSTQEKLPPFQHKVTLYTTLVVREDSMTLYGFASRQEKRFFETVVNSVKGFGPRLALAALSAMPVSALCQAIATENLALLSKISGIGKKSAAQFVLDMKGRIEEFGATAAASPIPGAASLGAAAQDAVKALETLGYKHDDAMRAVAEITANSGEKELSTSEIIKLSLGRFRG